MPFGEGGSRLLVASLDSLRRRSRDLVVDWTFPAMGVAPLRPSCGCRSPEISGGRITRRRHGTADPLPHLPAIAGRRHSSVLCFAAAGDDHGLLAHQAGWSCSQDGSLRLPPEADGESGATGRHRGQRKEIMARLPVPGEDTQKQAPAGVFGLTRAGHSGGTDPIGSVPRFPQNFGS